MATQTEKSPRLNFTNAQLAKLPIPETGRVVYRDHGGQQSITGLQCWVSSSGHKSFVLRKKLPGQKSPVSVTIGTFPELAVDAARSLARDKIAMLQGGVNPNEVKRKQAIQGTTFGQAFKDYMQSGKQRSQNTIGNYQTIRRKYLYDWLDTPVKSITTDAISKRHTAISKGSLPPGDGYKASDMKPSVAAANKTVRIIRAVINFAMDQYPELEMTDNPVRKMPVKVNTEKSRRTRLWEADLPAWFEAVEALRQSNNLFDVTAADYLTFVLMTGLRRREASGLTWDRVNMRNRHLTLLDTKSGEPLLLPIPDYLMDILKRRQKLGGEYVFPGGGKNNTLDDPRRQIAWIRSQSGVSFTIHDLRRTFGSIAASQDINFAVLKTLLNHSKGRDVTENHYVSLDVERLRRPMQAISAYILRAAGISQNNVTALPVADRAGGES